MTIANTLRHLRTQKGLTQEQLSAAAGLSQQLISKIERGLHVNPTCRTLRAISEALDVSVVELLPDDEPVAA